MFDGIEDLRIALGITQEGMASILGVSRQQYSKYTKGNVTPHPDSKQRIEARIALLKDLLETKRYVRIDAISRADRLQRILYYIN